MSQRKKRSLGGMLEQTPTPPPAGVAYPATPALDKPGRVHVYSQTIGTFIDWLHEHRGGVAFMHEHGEACYDDDGCLSCGMREGDYYPDHRSIEKLLADYFGIDLEACERERRAILEHIRSDE